MSKKIVKYYNFVVKVETEDYKSNRESAENVSEWFSRYLCDDNDLSDGTWSLELVKFTEKKKVKK